MAEEVHTRRTGRAIRGIEAVVQRRREQAEPGQVPPAAAGVLRDPGAREQEAGASGARAGVARAVQAKRDREAAEEQAALDQAEAEADARARKRSILEALRNPDRIDGATGVADLNNKEH